MDTHTHYAKAFNKWMDDYANNPEAYEAMNEVARKHLEERMNGQQPTYGDAQAATFAAYLASA